MPLFEMPGAAEKEVVPSGFRPLDRLLPRGGFCRGSLVEWLGDDDVSGAATLATAVAVSLATNGTTDGTVIVVDRGGRFHPPAVMPWLASTRSAGSAGASQPQCIVARPARDDDEVWAIDQALRCPGVAAVLAWPRRIHPTAMRRWQLAARSSLAVGLLVRPARARREPSWAMHRIAVAPVVGGPSNVRRLRLSRVGGPWSDNSLAGGDLNERPVEIVLDLVRGREAVATDQRLANVPPSLQCPRLPQQLLPSQGGASCRAS